MTCNHDHDNPKCICNTTNAERADLMDAKTDRIEEATGEVPLLMPLVPPHIDGKEPIIEGKYRLDSEKGRSLLVDARDAAEAVRDYGDRIRGFALYYGKPEHNTEDLLAADHDDLDAFPTDFGPDTLEAISGSGAGRHQDFLRGEDLPLEATNAEVKVDGEAVGEIRARNLYCIYPGSIHPSGGIYHLSEDREIATLTDDHREKRHRPASASTGGGGSSGGSSTATTTAGVPDIDPAETPEGGADAFVNARGERLAALRERDDKLDRLLSEQHPGEYDEDTSRVDYHAIRRLLAWEFSKEQVARIVKEFRARPKVTTERPDYLPRTIQAVERDGYETAYRTAVLPPAVRYLDGRRGGDEELLQKFRDRCAAHVYRAASNWDHALIGGLPGLGKSHGAGEATAKLIRRGAGPVLITTELGREGRYEDYLDRLAAENIEDSRIKVLPSGPRECETARGEHGEDAYDLFWDRYRRDATPAEIHERLELPCGEDCPFHGLWTFDPAEYDVLIGHPSHLHLPHVRWNRVTFIDEFPGEAFETTVGFEAITEFLKTHPGIPFDNPVDLANHDGGREYRAALDFFESRDGLERDPDQVFHSDEGHALGGLAAYTLLESSDLENGFAATGLPRCDSAPAGGVGVLNKEEGRVSMLVPPNLRDCRSVVGLDGTPNHEMWMSSLGMGLDHRQVLSDEERREYITDALGLRVIQTTDRALPYHKAGRVQPRRDEALIRGIEEIHGESPGVISSKAALVGKDGREAAWDFEIDGPTQHFGAVLGSNEFKDKHLGAVIGGSNFGDHFVKRWTAYIGKVADEPDRSGPDTRGMDLSYGEHGDQILTWMREQRTTQRVLRFGRDGEGATVYAHAPLEDWFPVAGRGTVTPDSAGMAAVQAALGDMNPGFDAGDMARHEEVDVGQRQVQRHLNTIHDRGVIEEAHNGGWKVATTDAAPGEVDLPEPADPGVDISRKDIHTSDVDPPPHESRVERDSTRIDPSEWGGPVESVPDKGDPPPD